VFVSSHSYQFLSAASWILELWICNIRFIFVLFFPQQLLHLLLMHANQWKNPYSTFLPRPHTYSILMDWTIPWTLLLYSCNFIFWSSHTYPIFSHQESNSGSPERFILEVTH
jgi:hypothetical protein